MDNEIKAAESVEFQGKDKTKLPANAVVLKKDIRISVEEIENGFIIKKTFDLKYSIGDKIDYLYYTKKVFSKKNPIKIEEDKMLAEHFN